MTQNMLAASAVCLSLMAGPALAQAAAPIGPPSSTSPEPQLVRPSGVGGCIYRKLPESVSREAINAEISHGDIVSVLRGPVAKVAPSCTGGAFSGSDGAVVGSVFSVYSRMIAAYELGRRFKLPQRQLDAVWRSATPDEKAPFLASAQTFVSPDRTFAAAGADAAMPFVARLALGEPSPDPIVPKFVYMYYSATALSEVAEASLAARGARAADP